MCHCAMCACACVWRATDNQCAHGFFQVSPVTDTTRALSFSLARARALSLSLLTLSMSRKMMSTTTAPTSTKQSCCHSSCSRRDLFLPLLRRAAVQVCVARNQRFSSSQDTGPAFSHAHCACIHICSHAATLHTYIHTYMHTCAHTYIHACMHAHACIRSYIHTHIHPYYTHPANMSRAHPQNASSKHESDRPRSKSLGLLVAPTHPQNATWATKRPSL